ncbi:MAG TPA: hypothetical protein ENG14_05125 [Thermodesulforhabdus norvegica]|uniref:Uncharacterized protein n=1 Tax=Thermodesulforhabdus norvegica TaxID=39841 RepID=A0A7C0WVN0_9BACT|nr:hypothetical protein [Thermodesulforhabdus norvegica]
MKETETTVYITRYALTKGIYVETGKILKISGNDYFKVAKGYRLFNRDSYHREKSKKQRLLKKKNGPK